MIGACVDMAILFRTYVRLDSEVFMRKLLTCVSFIFCIDGAVGMNPKIDWNSIYNNSNEMTSAAKAMDECIDLLRTGRKTHEVIKLFNSAFEDTGDDPGYYTELRRLAMECKANKKVVDAKFWSFYGLTAAGHEYFRKLSGRIPRSKFIANLKKAFLQS